MAHESLIAELSRISCEEMVPAHIEDEEAIPAPMPPVEHIEMDPEIPF